MTNLVTGSFGFVGKYISKLLLEKGETVRTITSKKDKGFILENKVEIFPYNFENKEQMKNALKGIRRFFITYWIRFPYKNISFKDAYCNLKFLIENAREENIKKIIFISITNANINSEFEYFKYKGIIEEIIKDSGISYLILRPTVIFGKESILINNIAYFLRKFPFFVIFGSGNYLIQPVYVEDLARIAVSFAEEKDNKILDMVGPEIFKFKEISLLMKEKISSKVKFVNLPLFYFPFITFILNIITRDIVLTKEEICALKKNLLVSNQEPLGQKKFSLWIEENKEKIGTKYFSELQRHYK